MTDEDPPKFTCKECGGHTLIVWNVLAGVNSERWQEWGPLKNNHHWRYEFRGKIEDDVENEVQRGDFEEDDSARSSRVPGQSTVFVTRFCLSGTC